MDSIDKLQQRQRQFVKERNWEKFHSPKNLAIALSVEAAELVEVFMWLSDAQCASLTPARLQEAKDEMGDVFLYLLRLADVLGIDLKDAVEQKFEKVLKKYTLEKARELTASLES